MSGLKGNTILVLKDSGAEVNGKGTSWEQGRPLGDCEISIRYMRACYDTELETSNGSACDPPQSCAVSSRERGRAAQDKGEKPVI